MAFCAGVINDNKKSYIPVTNITDSYTYYGVKFLKAIYKSIFGQFVNFVCKSCNSLFQGLNSTNQHVNSRCISIRRHSTTISPGKGGPRHLFTHSHCPGARSGAGSHGNIVCDSCIGTIIIQLPCLQRPVIDSIDSPSSLRLSTN